MRDLPPFPALMVVLAMACIVLGDTGGKTMTAQGISPYFAAWGRFALAAVALAPFAGLRRADLPAFGDWRVLLRTGLVVAGITAILTALRTEPIANVFGAFFVGPVVAYFGSALLLKERVTLIRALLLLVGFGGVLLVVKPGFGMSFGMAMALLAGTFYGSYLVATRLIAGVYRPRLLLLSQLAIGAVVLTPLAAVIWPATLPPGFAWAFPLSAIGSAMGNYLLLIASRSLPANVVAPLVYSQILWAMVLGFAVFGDWPDSLALAGLVIILISGLLGLRLAGRGR
ncbi:membrane protein, putative [Pseudooceanicola batsensis HTCC2597]|uniref:Membrane protein, putative n=1 Tax=Pseudooceanicola batsensis (strain ATCC BAA-863 / DSM 15984 / KCTC 12145 / HTCC2597) TaxID=252305 RepID=A3TVY7_PSEBH|nr:DMT family transporter [Pseudooceanicola batsensis]EAQ03783.1 membrane protein, putative [Pseudooceanicola batsensis HTCC2597]